MSFQLKIPTDSNLIKHRIGQASSTDPRTRICNGKYIFGSGHSKTGTFLILISGTLLITTGNTGFPIRKLMYILSQFRNPGYKAIFQLYFRLISGILSTLIPGKTGIFFENAGFRMA
jgi:hypothetical protein